MKESSSYWNSRARSSAQAMEQTGEREEMLAVQMEWMKALQKDAPEKHHEQIYFLGHQGSRRAEVQRRIGSVREKHRLQRQKKESDNAQVQEEREKLMVKGGVTSTTSRSLYPSFEVEMTEELLRLQGSSVLRKRKEAGGLQTWKEERRSLR